VFWRNIARNAAFVKSADVGGEIAACEDKEAYDALNPLFFWDTLQVGMLHKLFRKQVDIYDFRLVLLLPSGPANLHIPLLSPSPTSDWCASLLKGEQAHHEDIRIRREHYDNIAGAMVHLEPHSGVRFSLIASILLPHHFNDCFPATRDNARLVLVRPTVKTPRHKEFLAVPKMGPHQVWHELAQDI
jgi:hypothetical protein